MHMLQNRSGLPSVWGLVLVGVLAACGSDSSDDKMVAVNLSLIVDGRQAHDRSAPSRLFAWKARWFPGATPAVASTLVRFKNSRRVPNSDDVQSPMLSFLFISSGPLPLMGRAREGCSNYT